MNQFTGVNTKNIERESSLLMKEKNSLNTKNVMNAKKTKMKNCMIIPCIGNSFLINTYKIVYS